MVLNPNNEPVTYHFQINDKRFSSTIHQNIELAEHAKKKIKFRISTLTSLISSANRNERIKVEIIDVNDSSLNSKQEIGFIIKDR